jgi:hypothetical protein
MKAILLAILYQTTRTLLARYIAGGLFERIEGLVMEMTDTTLSGADKAQAVRDAVLNEWDAISHLAVNLAIEVIVARLRFADE